MTFWTPARTESLQAPPHCKCGGISNISHWQKDLTAGVHTRARLLFSLLFIYFCVPSFTPHILGSCQIGSKVDQIQRYSFTPLQMSPLEEVVSQKAECVIRNLKLHRFFPDILLLYVSNQQLNVNVSLAPAGLIGPESVCVCLTPKCLKCPLSAPLSFSLSIPLSFLWLCCWCICQRHNIRTLVQLIEPICCKLLLLSSHPLDNTLSRHSSLVPLTSYKDDELI